MFLSLFFFQSALLFGQLYLRGHVGYLELALRDTQGMNLTTTTANQSAQATRDCAVSSAVADHVYWPRVTAMACESLVYVFGIPASLFWLAATGNDHWRFESSPALVVACLISAALGLSQNIGEGVTS